MAQSIKMPALGESVTEGTVTAWLKKVGDQVELDEPIVEVATDKVDSEVPSPVAGVLLEILVEEDDTVEVGTEIARVGDASELGSAAPTAVPSETAEVVPSSGPSPSETPEQADTTPITEGNLTEVKMPALGESVTEGTVTAWLKQFGDKVEVDEALVEVATDKVDSEVPSPVSGYLAEIRANEDDTVEVGTIIAVISASSVSNPNSSVPPIPKESVASPTTPSSHAAPKPPVPPVQSAPAPAPAWANAPVTMPAPQDAQAVLDAAATAAASTGKIVATATGLPAAGGYVTPLVRKLAREKGVDLSKVVGSGVGGRIRKEDVLAAAQPTTSSSSPSTVTPLETNPLRGKTEKMSRLRQTIANRMVESLQTSAQLTTVIEVDVTKIADLRSKNKEAFQQKHGTKLTFLPFFVKAATEALKQHPKINATINGKEVTYFDYENIGIAVDAPKGLMVPVIKNAGDLNLAGIAGSINSLAAKTRDGAISPDDLTGSTFTITNTGSGGALFDTPVLNMPEVAILGVGTIVKRPVVIKDSDGKEAIGIHSMVYLALSYDHRLVDGADASRYLMTIKKRLEEGNFDSDLELL